MMILETISIFSIIGVILYFGLRRAFKSPIDKNNIGCCDVKCNIKKH